MFDFYERRKIRQWLYSWPFLVVLIITSIFLAHGVWGVYQQERLTRINKNQRLAHLEGLEVREDALKEEIDRLNTDRGIEEEIRQKFEVAKEGEGVIVIVEPPSDSFETNNRPHNNIFSRFYNVIIFWR